MAKRVFNLGWIFASCLAGACFQDSGGSGDSDTDTDETDATSSDTDVTDSQDDGDNSDGDNGSGSDEGTTNTDSDVTDTDTDTGTSGGSDGGTSTDTGTGTGTGTGSGTDSDTGDDSATGDSTGDDTGDDTDTGDTGTGDTGTGTGTGTDSTEPPNPCDGSSVQLFQQAADTAGRIVSYQTSTAASEAADDFTVDSACWCIKAITVLGSYDGMGPPEGNELTLSIYDDATGSPGSTAWSLSVEPTSDSSGILTVALDEPAVLSAGTYWLGAQRDMTGSTDKWYRTSSDAAGTLAFRHSSYPDCNDWVSGGSTCGGQPIPDFALAVTIMGTALASCP